MIRTRGLSHVELRVADLEHAVRFYGEVFGFEVVVRRDGRALLEIPGGRGSIAVELSGDGAPPAGATHFGLTLADPAELDAAVHLAIAHGATLVERNDHRLGTPTATLADPSGHHITL